MPVYEKKAKVDARQFTGGTEEAIEIMQWLWKEHTINATHTQVKDTYLVFSNPSSTVKNETIKLSRNGKTVTAEMYHYIVVEGSDFFVMSDGDFRCVYQEVSQ